MSRKGSDLTTGGRVPELNGIIPGTGKDMPPIRADCYGVNRTQMPQLRKNFRPSDCSPGAYIRPIVGKSAKDAERPANTDLPAVIVFSLIGLLLTLYLMRSFPDLGALVAQYNQF